MIQGLIYLIRVHQKSSPQERGTINHAVRKNLIDVFNRVLLKKITCDNC